MTTEPAAPPILAYAAPRDRSFPAFYVVYFVMISLPAVIFAYSIYVLAPKFAEIFKDFKTDLPVMTKWLMYFAWWCRSPLVWPFLLAALLTIPWLLAKLTLRFQTATQRLTAAMIIMMALMFLVLTACMAAQVALFLPLVKLVQSVSGGA